MKQLICLVATFFLLICIAIFTFEYQPHYKKEPVVSNPPTINIAENDLSDNYYEPEINDLSETLSVYEKEKIEEVFYSVLEDDYDFSNINNSYRQQIIEFYQNGYYYNTWKILNDYVQFDVISRRQGKDNIYYTLGITSIVPKDISYCADIYETYKEYGTFESIENYLTILYTESNVYVKKEHSGSEVKNYFDIDHNFYDFIIMTFTKDKLYGDVVQMRDYVITLDRNPY